MTKRDETKCPEGDTIYRAARALHKALAGKEVVAFEAALAKLASVDDNTPVKGRIVERVEARGKWCLIFFSGDLILLTHMLMSGSWHLYRTDGERWRLPRGTDARGDPYGGLAGGGGFNIPVAEFYTARSLERNSQVPKLGPATFWQRPIRRSLARRGCGSMRLRIPRFRLRSRC